MSGIFFIFFKRSGDFYFLSYLLFGKGINGDILSSWFGLFDLLTVLVLVPVVFYIFYKISTFRPDFCVIFVTKSFVLPSLERLWAWIFLVFGENTLRYDYIFLLTLLDSFKFLIFLFDVFLLIFGCEAVCIWLLFLCDCLIDLMSDCFFRTV